MQSVLGNFPPTMDPGWTPSKWHKDGLPVRGPGQVRQWTSALHYDVEQALMFVIDQQPWVVRQGARWQIWPQGGGAAMAALAEARHGEPDLGSGCSS